MVLDDEDDDEVQNGDAVEGLMTLQGGIAGLSVKDKEEEGAGEGKKSSGNPGPSVDESEKAHAQQEEEEDAAAAAEEYNSAVFWKNTYAVPIDDT